MKCAVLLALVGAAVAVQFRQDVIPKAAEQLRGTELRDYVNTVQSHWKAGIYEGKDRRSSLMAIKYTKLPNDVTYLPKPSVKAAIPESFDAREAWPNCPNIGTIRDQSQCGSCWAFGAAEAMSDRFCIHSNGAQQPFLASEELLSCCGFYCGYGCEGGYPIRAWNWWVQKGLVTGGGFYEQEGCKPYSIEPCGTHVVNGVSHTHDCYNYEPDTPSCASSCTNKNYATPYSQDKFFGKSAYAVQESVEAIQTEIMTNGPVEAAFTVYEDFYNYVSGVYKHVAGGVLGGHAVRILGWGTENGQKYWLVANSWNTDWGENGYFKIVRGSNDCGIEEAIVAGLPKV